MQCSGVAMAAPSEAENAGDEETVELPAEKEEAAFRECWHNTELGVLWLLGETFSEEAAYAAIRKGLSRESCCLQFRQENELARQCLRRFRRALQVRKRLLASKSLHLSCRCSVHPI